MARQRNGEDGEINWTEKLKKTVGDLSKRQRERIRQVGAGTLRGGRDWLERRKENLIARKKAHLI